MKELIAITTGGQGSPVVSARELHEFLGVKSRFADWIKVRVVKYKFLEGTDYEILNEGKGTFSKISEKLGRPELDYALTLDTAKQLAMVERTEKGRQARLYFIDCEKRLNKLAPALPNQLLVDHAQRIADLEQQLKQMIDSQQQAARSLLDIPRSSETLPEETTRIKVQRLVNAYCRAKSVGQQEVWRKVYDRLYYLYKINIRAHKRSERESWLDVVDRKGYMDKVYAIASAELTYEEE
ncbi:antA/AntB antirepressor family protein [Spirosoma oryzicola]|uniref:antA/AntB antirepressor family protein n=1 Tax=Spirosoma oryzicola TaxID=2898794 RepID=UPI001E590AA0|nr:antA/AntB antirepressor family protein [Spirosoma oryzicola]UHG93191.1 antA/AntB antirepressor family protein [Spirosoma oryzicola]